MTWSIRQAEARDRDGLVALCHAAVGPDDYVPAFLEDFLTTGLIFVAEDRGHLVGMVVYHDCPDRSAWLHAARTHPEHRREGVATALMARCESTARQRHRSALRLWASLDNQASVRANRKYGYRERGRFTRMRLEVPRPGPRAHLELLDLEEDWPRLRDSRLLRQSHGYVFHDFYFMPLTRATASWLQKQQALWRFGDNAVSLSAGLEDASRRGIQMHLLVGDAAEILAAAPSIAAARGVAEVECFLPHDARLLATARHAGFEFMGWGREAVLFELRPRPARAAGAGTGHRRA